MLHRPPSHNARHWITKALTVVSVVSVFTLSGSAPLEGASLFPNIPGCPVDKRFSQWGTFAQNGVSFRDFLSTWSDVFTKNACQQVDIFNLLEAIQSAETQLRKKIFACQTSGVQQLSQQLNELRFELEYVRHMMDTDEEKPSPDGSKALVRHPDKVRQLLLDSVVTDRKLVGAERFAELFTKFEAKYAPKIDSYRDCKSEDWEALRETWNGFADSWGGLAPAWKKLKTNTSTKVDALTGPSGRSDEFLSGFVDIKVNGLQPQQTLSGIVNQLEKNAKDAPTPDFLNILKTAEGDYGRYLNQETQAKRRATYEVLYKQFSDSAASQMLKEVQNLNAMIDGSTQPMAKVQQCTAYIAKRQCVK